MKAFLCIEIRVFYDKQEYLPTTFLGWKLEPVQVILSGSALGGNYKKNYISHHPNGWS